MRAYVEDVLGPKLTAFLTGDSQDAAQPIASAYRIVRLLTEHETHAVIRAWFIGMNPNLDDSSPAETIAAGNYREAWAAAQTYTVGG